jgi:hypothetical protein
VPIKVTKLQHGKIGLYWRRYFWYLVSGFDVLFILYLIDEVLGWCQSATQFGRSTICAAWFIFWKEKFEGLTVSPVLNLNPTF